MPVIKVVKGKNDLATTHPEVASRLVNQQQATEYQARTKDKLLWFCDRGHGRVEYSQAVSSMVAGKNACPLCGGPGRPPVGTVQDIAPDMAAHMVHDWEKQKSVSSRDKATFWCADGHGRVQYQQVVRSYWLGHNGCPDCGGPGRHD